MEHVGSASMRWPASHGQTYSYTVRPATMVRTTRPCSARLVERRVLAARLEPSRIEHPGLVEVDDDEVGGRARPQRAAGQARAARPARVDIASSSGQQADLAVVDQPQPAASRVSSPIAPAAASAKGRRLVSTSCGSWSETMTSIEARRQRLDQRQAVVLGAQRRRELEEGAVGADVVLVERQMVDRGAAVTGRPASLARREHVAAIPRR